MTRTRQGTVAARSPGRRILRALAGVVVHQPREACEAAGFSPRF